MRGIDRFLKLQQRIFIQPHLVDRAGKRALVQNTNDDFFSMRRGQNRDTKIDFLAHDFDAETSVLRDASLGDVQAGQNFDARGNRQLQRLGRRFRGG